MVCVSHKRIDQNNGNTGLQINYISLTYYRNVTASSIFTKLRKVFKKSVFVPEQLSLYRYQI